MTKAKSFYKGHYLIALYNAMNDDEFEAVFTNGDELSLVTYASVSSALSHYFNDSDRTSVYYQGRRCIPYLIDAFEDDEGKTVREFSDSWSMVFPDDTMTTFIEGRKKTKSSLDDETFKDCIIDRIRSERRYLRIWIRKRDA